MFTKVRKDLIVRIVLVLMFIFGRFDVIPAYASTMIHHVKWDASGANTGASWADAYTDLQSALSAASSGDEIWVAAGTYYPTSNIDRTISFTLKNGVAIYGGFVGIETLITQRDPLANVTILSGDIGVIGDNTDNSYHVTSAHSINYTAVMDGFTVKAGNANISNGNYGNGGGMYSAATGGIGPSLANVIFTDNFATWGGGMYSGGSTPSLTNVTFHDNSAYHGGGIYSEDNSTLSLTNVTLKDNSAGNGGGMYTRLSKPSLTNVTFSGNSANYGGGMYSVHSTASLTNVTFKDNSAIDGDGGGMYNYASASTLATVSFSGNSADRGGGIYNTSNSNPMLTDITFSGNTAYHEGGGMYNYTGSPTLTSVTFSSNTAGGHGGGISNTSSSPVLTDVTFSGNSAHFGGGMQNYNSSNPSLVNVTFSNNSADYEGGGISNTSNSNPMLTNVTFSGNLSSVNGGAMFNEYSSPTLTNVTFSGNSATTSSSINRGGGIFNIAGNPIIRNTIFWGNTAPSAGGQIYNYGSSSPMISDSVMQDGCPAGSTCTNIITTNPLLGLLQDNGGFTQTIALGAGSPAIDAVDDSSCPETDQRDMSRPQGSHCDMGAYEAKGPIEITIGGVEINSYSLALNESERVSFASVNNGPVKMVSTDAVPIIVAERHAWLLNGVVQSFSEMMGLPGNQVTDTYYFPWYNNVTMDTQLRFANLGNTSTNITVTIAGIAQPPITVAAGESTRVSYPGINAGPVKVQSSGGVPIIVAERDAWLLNGVVQSFSEMMGLPGNQVTDTYYFPWYNNVTMDTQLRFANLGNTSTNITVTIAGIAQTPIPLAAGESTRVSYPINNGPVKVQSTGGVPIIVAERDAWLISGVVRSFSEMMGLPGNQLTDTYYFPWYNNVTMDTQLRFANLGNTSTNVTVTIAGVAQTPITVAAGTSTRISYPVNNGPVTVTSSGGVPIIVAERDAWLLNGAVRSFSEMMGLPGNQLATTYYFPWYNNLTMDTQLRFAVP